MGPEPCWDAGVPPDAVQLRVVRRFTGAEARDGTAARELARELDGAGWVPTPVPPGHSSCIERAGLVPDSWR
ncbi:hypothetical protein [Isoptericola sp. 178]|uniref:hypothetical protein n=1 Tax=Isoptericola sp. 178 TaxID=3064651 RepID=UPI0027129B9F|nr:hypothetical protein [Isoptericola sp. 178]MDO8143113.1 hypothetical protein [Isoptericola sp. 178]